MTDGWTERRVLRAAWSQLKNDPVNAKMLNYVIMRIFNVVASDKP